MSRAAEARANGGSLPSGRLNSLQIWYLPNETGCQRKFSLLMNCWMLNEGSGWPDDLWVHLRPFATAEMSKQSCELRADAELRAFHFEAFKRSTFRQEEFSVESLSGIMNEIQYDRAWQQFNVPKLETPRKEEKWSGRERTFAASHTQLSTHKIHTFGP